MPGPTLPVTLEAIADLAWPLLVAVLIWRLSPTLRRILESRAFTVKVGQTQISVQDASDQLRIQIEDLQNQIVALRQRPEHTDARDVVTSPAEPARAVEPVTILWVDDVPENNAYEVAKLESDGFRVAQARSTDEAMEFLSEHPDTAVVISDMGRREGGRFRSEAGLDLLKNIRSQSLSAPFIVYTTGKQALRQDQAVREAGGSGATASPINLLDFIKRTAANPDLASPRKN